jgi:transcriptional regulator with XRE-family HTH domain
MTLNLAPAADATGPSDALVLAMAHQRMRGNPAHHIAAGVPVHPSELSRWVNGRRLPTLEQAQRLAEILGERLEVLFPVLENELPAGPGRELERRRDDARSQKV